MVIDQIMNHKTYRHYAKLVIKSKQKKMEITRIVKKCAMCFTEKEITDFNLSNRKYGDGRSSYCRECQSTYYKAYNEARKAAQPKVVLMFKTCRDCGSEKPISQFGKRSLSLDKHNIYCKPCWKQRCKVATRRMKNGG